MIKESLKLIKSGEASCVIIRNGEIIHSELSRGIKPMLFAYENGLLAGATVVDKVVGRAAAMVMALGGAKACYALTVSEGAIAYFTDCGIDAQYENRVEYIVNRGGNGMCPMESAVQGVNDPAEALLRVKIKLNELSRG